VFSIKAMNAKLLHISEDDKIMKHSLWKSGMTKPERMDSCHVQCVSLPETSTVWPRLCKPNSCGRPQGETLTVYVSPHHQIHHDKND